VRGVPGLRDPFAVVQGVGTWEGELVALLSVERLAAALGSATAVEVAS
jgi:hypothetical protein